MKYLRTTHDEDGNCLFDFDGKDDFIIHGVGVHGFDPEIPMSLEEYHEFHREYCEEWHPEDNIPVPSKEELMIDINEMLERGMIKEVS